MRGTADHTYLFLGIGRPVYIVLAWRGRASMAFDGGNPVADRPTNLPVRLPSLIGREEAIALVRNRLLEAEQPGRLARHTLTKECARAAKRRRVLPRQPLRQSWPATQPPDPDG